MKCFQLVMFAAVLALSTDARHLVLHISGPKAMETFRNLVCEPKSTTPEPTTTTPVPTTTTPVPTPYAELSNTPSFPNPMEFIDGQLGPEVMSEFNDEPVSDSTVDVATENHFLKFLDTHGTVLTLFLVVFLIFGIFIILKYISEVNYLKQQSRDEGCCSNCKTSKIELPLRKMALRKPMATPTSQPKAPPAYEEVPPSYDNVAAAGVQILPPAIH